MAYPATLDELPKGVQNQTDTVTGEPDPKYTGPDPEGEGDHAERHNALADAINRTQAELGTDPSGASATVKARMEALGLTLASKADTTAVSEALVAKASKAELAAEESARISGLATKAAATHAAQHALGGADPLALPQYDTFEQFPGLVPMGLFPGTTITPTAKRGYFTRFMVPKKRPIKFVRFTIGAVGTGEDEIDSAIYQGVSTTKIERLASSGPVKYTTNSIGVKVAELTATVNCEPGIPYFVAQEWKTVTGTPQTLAPLNNNGSVGNIFGTTDIRNRLFWFKASMDPLPATVESPEGSTVNPWLVPSES